MKKLPQFQPELVTKAFPEEGFRKEPSKINKGNCMRWAYMAFQMFQGVELWYMTAHAFIRFQGKFYDSERLEGVEDWKDLPATNFGQGCGCHRCQKPARKVNVNAFKKAWNSNFIKPNWKNYREQAAKVLDENK